jgi:hypothetical protein
MSGLARVYYLEGMRQKASDLYREVVEAQSKVLGRDHVSTLYSMCGLACVYSRLFKKRAALGILEEVLQLQMRVLGSDHYRTLETREKFEEVVSELRDKGLNWTLSRKVGRV